LQTAPGLIVFGYAAELFYANATRFSDDVQKVIDEAPEKVQWLVLDAAGIDDIDYSAGIALGHVIDFIHSRGGAFVLAAANPTVMQRLADYGISDRIAPEHFFDGVDAAVAAFRQSPAAT
jgi:MFS superfamily sulfate permease-like transporter